MKRHYFGLVTLAALTISTQIFAQAVTAGHDRPLAPSIIIPQSRSFSSIAPRPVIQITGVEARVSIVEQVATTTMLVSLRNTSRTRREAEMIVPVPDGAVVRGFTFQGAASEPTAQVLPKAQHVASTTRSWPRCSTRHCSSSSATTSSARASFRTRRELRRGFS